MKKINLLSTLMVLSTVALLVSSYSNGTYIADYTGSTGLGQSCAQTGCHTGGGTSGVDTSRLIVKVIDPSGVDVDAYTLNQNYTVEVKFRLDGCTKAGFQVLPNFFFTTAKAGVVTNNIQPTKIQIFTDGSNREYVSQTTAGNNFVAGTLYTSWKFKWTAPAVVGNAISFNCIVNKTNGNQMSSGDSCFTSIKVLQVPQISTGVFNADFNTGITIFPNPTSNILNIESAMLNNAQVSVVDVFGKIYLKQTVTSASNKINTSALANGTYFLMIEKHGMKAVKPFTKN
jgi:hypothetical protein